jgi:hypothetical protein
MILDARSAEHKKMQVPISNRSAPLHAMKACGGEKYRSTISLPRRYVVVSSQLQA